MLLRTSISNTKKFFQKTFINFKSFLSKNNNNNTYERLPKTTTFNPFSCGRNDHINIETGYKDLDNFYNEFTHQWDSHKGKQRKKIEKKKIVPKSTQKSQEFLTSSTREEKMEEKEEEPMIPKITKQRNESYQDENAYNKIEDLKCKLSKSDICSKSVREKRSSLIEMKLKEFEEVDKGNVEHKLDVDEILHYYSRLTCPPFLDIVDRYFMEICGEFYGPLGSPKGLIS